MFYRILCSFCKSISLSQEYQSTQLTSYTEILLISTEKPSLKHGSSLAVPGDAATPWLMSGRVLFVWGHLILSRCVRKARTTGLIPQLPKTVASMSIGSGSPAPVGKYSPGNFKPQVWEYSPRVRGCELQSGAMGRTSQRLHPLDHCCCPHSVRYYTWQMQSCEREKKCCFFLSRTHR